MYRSDNPDRWLSFISSACLLQWRLDEFLTVVYIYWIETHRNDCPCENAAVGPMWRSRFFAAPAGILLSSQKSTFCPLAEKLWTGSKNGWHHLGWARRALSPCKVWGRSNNARRLYRCENVVFLSRSDPAGCAFDGVHYIVRTIITSRFMDQFWCRFQFFPEGIVFSEALHSSSFVARWRHNIREIAVKNCEKSKNRRKSLCSSLRIDSWAIWKKSTA